ncbi:MAG: sugar ABC transporter permease [Anaerolineales bacterium]
MDLAIEKTSPARKPLSLLARIVGAESELKKKDALEGYLFALPWIIGLIVFVAGPIIASIYLSLNDYSVLSGATWVGLKNYQRAFFEDPLFWPSLGRTFYYAGAVVPISLVGSLLLASLLNQQLRGTNIFRSLFFLPHLTPTVALAVLWSWLLHPHLGPVNMVIQTLGMEPYPFLTSRSTVIPSMIMISTWSSVGGNNMLIFLAGLQGVPTELYEAADMDGASSVRKFFSITLPMISPSILFNLVMGVINALKVFGLAYVATNGGPNYGSWFFALHIYNQAFAYFRLGYGSALAWFFAVILIVFTLIQLKLSDRWVFYAGAN